MNAKQLIASDVRRLREELNERQLRERCLLMAVSAGGHHAPTVVKAAEEYVAFITRARPAKRAK